MRTLPKLRLIQVHTNGIFEAEGFNDEEFKTLAAFKKFVIKHNYLNPLGFLDTVLLTYGIGRTYKVTYEFKHIKNHNWILTGGGKNKKFHCDDKVEFFEIIQQELEQI